MSQEGFLGEVKMFAGSFAPRDWAFCQGQLMSIQQNQALFSIIGTIYGGDGRSTFALPDLRGRTAISPGSGPGLTPRTEGQPVGGETNTLTSLNLPNHHHALVDGAAGATVTVAKPTANAIATSTVSSHLLAGQEGMGQTPSDTPNNNYLGKSLNNSTIYRPNPGSDVVRGLNVQVDTQVGVVVNAPTAAISGITANTGSGQAVNNMQPSLPIYYIICIAGTFPSRS